MGQEVPTPEGNPAPKQVEGVNQAAQPVSDQTSVPESEQKPYQVFAKTLTGYTMTLETCGSDTIA